MLAFMAFRAYLYTPNKLLPLFLINMLTGFKRAYALAPSSSCLALCRAIMNLDTSSFFAMPISVLLDIAKIEDKDEEFREKIRGSSILRLTLVCTASRP